MLLETVNRWGDFTHAAPFYNNRPNYSDVVLRSIAGLAGAGGASFRVAEIGAGTGILTRGLLALGLQGYAIEPNDAMREEGSRSCGADSNFEWLAGSGESTPLADSSVDWVCMGTAYQFVDTKAALVEFRRILRPDGTLSILWNLIDFEHSPLDQMLEDRMRQKITSLRRSYHAIEDRMAELQESQLFGDCLYSEAGFSVQMPNRQYLDMWRSQHDVPSQVTPAVWDEILNDISTELQSRPTITTRWTTKAWTLRVRKPH